MAFFTHICLQCLAPVSFHFFFQDIVLSISFVFIVENWCPNYIHLNTYPSQFLSVFYLLICVTSEDTYQCIDGWLIRCLVVREI